MKFNVCSHKAHRHLTNIKCRKLALSTIQLTRERSASENNFLGVKRKRKASRAELETELATVNRRCIYFEVTDIVLGSL